jgi:rsbT antagonist protein RsbS
MQEAYNQIPIIKLWHLLLVPLQGEMTDDVASRLMTEVLERIYRDGSMGLVIDITGLWIIDSHLCSVLSQISDSAALMGARSVICGMKPEIALTLETMGVHLDNITSSLDLEGALSLLGVQKPDAKALRDAGLPGRKSPTAASATSAAK